MSAEDVAEYERVAGRLLTELGYEVGAAGRHREVAARAG
jgi:hypothetical protein